MKHLKKILFCFLLLNFIQGIYSYLYPNNGWPTSFEYHYGHAENKIKNMFKDEKVTKWFNQGYNPDDRYIPINKENKTRILDNLNEISNKAVFEAINQVKNCSAFNKLFGNKAERFLSRMKNRFTFTRNIPGGGREAECIVHCLTKKCIDSNYEFNDVEVEMIINWSRKIEPISCHKIQEQFWKGKDDIADEMNAGDCFCGIEWVENADCDEPIITAATTGSKKNRNDSPDDHYSFAAGLNYITNILSTAVFDFPIEGKRNFVTFNFFPDILIYEKYYGDIQNLLKKYHEFYISDYLHDYFSNHHKILFIGSGELIGDEKSGFIKQALENFVANGGVLFAQTQQYSSQIQDLVPVPENESLKFIGFRQD